MPGALQVDVGTVAAGHVLDRGDGVFLGDVDRHVGAARSASVSLSGAMSSATILAGNFARAPAIMPSPIGPQPATTTTSSKVRFARSTACSAQDSGSTNAAWAGGQVGADLVHQRVAGEDHVAGHRARRPPLEAVEVVRRAHVVLTADAVATLPARHDLLAGDPVADRDAPALRPLRRRAATTVPTNSCPGMTSRLDPRRTVVVAPELGRTVVALQVTGTDADRLHLDQGLARARRRAPGPPRARSPRVRGRRPPASCRELRVGADMGMSSSGERHHRFEP